MASATFIAKCQSTKEYPRIRFKYDTVDHSEYLLDVSNIRRDCNLSQGIATVTLRNDDAHWDIFLTTHTELRKKASLELYFDGLAEYLELFTGYVYSAEFDYGGKTVTLTIKDRIYECLQNTIINLSDPAAEIYYNYFLLDGSTRVAGHYVSEIVWHILVDYAKLDSTAAAGNTDIDYASWQAWATAVDNGGYTLYDICCYPKYSKCDTALLRIAQLTESLIWVGGDGKIKFKASTQSQAGQTYPKASGYLLDLKWHISLDDRNNAILANYKYNKTGGVWNDGGAYYHSHNYGPANFNQIFTADDKDFFHNSLTSVTKWVDEMFLRTAPPIREFEAPAQLLGFLEDVGNEITLTGFYSASPYDSIEIHLTDVEFDIANWTAILKGYYIWGAGEL